MSEWKGAQGNYGCLVPDPLTLINEASPTWRSLFKRGSRSEDEIIAHLVEMPSTNLDEGMSFGLQVYVTTFTHQTGFIKSHIGWKSWQSPKKRPLKIYLLVEGAAESCGK